MAAPARAPLDDRPLVLGTRHGGVLTLTLNRGERFHPPTISITQALLAAPTIGVFGSTPAVGVARNVGRKRAMEMLLTGDTIDARTALAWGLVNRVVTADALDAEVRRFTDQIVSRSAAAIRLGKRAFY